MKIDHQVHILHDLGCALITQRLRFSALIQTAIYRSPYNGAALSRYLNIRPEESYFWGVHEQSELDLYTEIKGKQIRFEFKYSDAPKLSLSMKNAMQTLKLHKLWVVYPGTKSYDLSPDIHVLPLSAIVKSKNFKFT